MSIRTILLIVLALLCGASAAVGVSQMTGGSRSSGVETVSVITAAQDVPRGGVLDQAALQVQQWPKHLVPKDSVKRVEDAAGRTVLVSLVKGEMLLASKITDKQTSTGLASMIAPGMRAFAIRTPHVAAGVAGFVLPGNRVDVLLTTTESRRDGTDGTVTTTLLQNVEVLAVDQRLDPADGTKADPDKLKSVTLLVTPDQAAKVDLGMNKGTLHLSLRNPKDSAEASTRPATMSDLRFHQEPVSGPPVESQAAVTPPPPAPVANPFLMIQTLRGEERGMVRVETTP